MLFSPYSGIWPHELQLIQLLEPLKEMTVELVQVSCGGALQRQCAVAEAFKVLTENSQLKACRRCRQSSCQTEKSLDSKHVSMAQYISEHEILEATSVSESLTSGDLISFTRDGVPLGKLTAYETLIKFKKTVVKFNGPGCDYWRNGIRQGIITQIASQRLLEKYQPDVALIYSPQYSAGSVFAEICRRLSIRTLFIEGSVNFGERYRAVHIWDWERFGLVDPAIHTFSADTVWSFGEQDFARASKHFALAQNSRALGVYSGNRLIASNQHVEVRHRHKNRVVLCVLSSHDEIFSGVTVGKIPPSMYYGSVFKNQFEWILYMKEFARRNDDIDFIIRLHPRMLPNRREKIQAEEVNNWNEVLSELPPNVTVDDTRAGISISSYLAFVDLVVTGWSSFALEAIYAGVRAISYDRKLSWFPHEIIPSATSVEEFETMILGVSPCFQTSELSSLARKWWAYRTIQGTIQLSGRLLDRFGLDTHPVFEKAYTLSVRYFLPVLAWIETNLCIRMTRQTDPRFEELLNADRDCLF